MILVPRLLRLFLSVFLVLLPAIVAAQGGKVGFGSSQQNSNLPIEIMADSLSVDQNENTATFTGNVLIGQGEMRLSASRVLVIYRADKSGVKMLKASGGVTLASGEDAAEAARAKYNVDTGQIEMQGNVLLVQGNRVLTGDRLYVDTIADTARMAGRVKTVLNQEPSQ
jgi:lipopolysaccharide export system protein LptA